MTILTSTQMPAPGVSDVHRWTKASRIAAWVSIAVVAGLALVPTFGSAGMVDRLAALFVYIILAAMWNALAGYGGLVSVGQQLFFGLGAYFTVRIAAAGVDPFVSMLLGAAVVGLLSYPLSFAMLRLKGGEFAIAMWVVSELAHLLVNLDGLIQGETGTSLISLNAYPAGTRRVVVYCVALAAMVALLVGLFVLLRSRVGSAIQAIRDSEEAAETLGVNVVATKRILFMLAAFGTAIAGAVWLGSATSFQPKTYFSVQWTAYMIFMVLVGGLGRFEGAILGAVIFFAMETAFGALGVWYLIGLGLAALMFSLFLPRGLWGAVEARLGLSLMPVGYRLNLKTRTE
ncbi:MAG: branched-chain amino acid ABC transporter permease [Rhizobium sp.]